MNPQHTVPTFNDNGQILWDSHAICTYLVDKYAATDHFYPKNHYIRGRINQRLHFNSGVLSPLSQRCFIPVVYQGAADFSDEHRSDIENMYDMLETFFEPEDKFLVGNRVTVADVCCGNTMMKFNLIVYVTGSRWPKVRSWLDKLQAIDSFRQLNEVGLSELLRHLPKKYLTT